MGASRAPLVLFLGEPGRAGPVRGELLVRGAAFEGVSERLDSDGGEDFVVLEVFAQLV